MPEARLQPLCRLTKCSTAFKYFSQQLTAYLHLKASCTLWHYIRLDSSSFRNCCPENIRAGCTWLCPLICIVAELGKAETNIAPCLLMRQSVPCLGHVLDRSSPRLLRNGNARHSNVGTQRWSSYASGPAADCCGPYAKHGDRLCWADLLGWSGFLLNFSADHPSGMSHKHVSTCENCAAIR